jgi:hypothetical protein
MDQAPLVERDIKAGRELVDLLMKAKGLRLEAAFWWWDDDQWRFIVATPLVHEKGRLAAYRKVQGALGIKIDDLKPVLDRLDILSPSEGVITALDIGSSARIPVNRLVAQEGIEGVYISGAYFYIFAPKSFAHA